MIKFIVTVKNDFSKFLIREISRGNLLGACRMEDDQITTQEEENDLLDVLKCYFKSIPININGRNGTINDVHYASLDYISASPLVRKWVEGNVNRFGITLQLDLEQHTTIITCDTIDDWFRKNNLYQFKIK